MCILLLKLTLGAGLISIAISGASGNQGGPLKARITDGGLKETLQIETAAGAVNWSGLSSGAKNIRGSTIGHGGLVTNYVGAWNAWELRLTGNAGTKMDYDRDFIFQILVKNSVELPATGSTLINLAFQDFTGSHIIWSYAHVEQVLVIPEIETSHLLQGSAAGNYKIAILSGSA